MAPDARYDGVTPWYDSFVRDYAPAFAALLSDHIGDAERTNELALDVGCGTGRAFEALRSHGYQPLGIDLSIDQLHRAQERNGNVVRADAAALPMPDDSLRIAVATFVHTDIDDFVATIAEVARVLRPNGVFAYTGTHPCFLGPFVRRTTERKDGELTIRPGYGDDRLVFEGSGGRDGLKAKVGSRNLSLGAFLTAFVDAGLRIERFEELDTEGRPWAARPADGTIVPWNVLVVGAKR